MFYTVREISNYLDVCENTVRNWIKEGKIKAVKLSNRDGYLIPEGCIFNFCKRTRYGVASLMTDDSGGSDISEVIAMIDKRAKKNLDEYSKLMEVKDILLRMES